MNAQIVTVSTKGQVALPVSIRKEMGIESGAKFVAFASGDTIMLKMVKLPSAEDFKKAMDEAQAWAADNGLNESDLNALIKTARTENK
ncbi:MAG: AbrB/MazE/SpoVT family DNA-binding domain-containing protein [Clostridia bacterium]|nr:AbrB/MazE/SpoVT family DNA-binding domain-containing protein [Clostridia bacterium]MBQ9880443.1 AbrB/MazE/SpoVT family DNA-binding domain-containing protein [Clostridia bacterium]